MEECFGCWQEARRADKIAAILLALRTSLDPDYNAHLTALLEEFESVSKLLRDLYDLFPIYRSRVPVVIYYLNVFLPSLQKTMRDMLIYVDNEGAYSLWKCSLKSRSLGIEKLLISRIARTATQGPMDIDVPKIRRSGGIDTAGKTSDVQWIFSSTRSATIKVYVFADSFTFSKAFRSSLYDPTSLEILRVRTLRLRKLQGIPGQYRDIFISTSLQPPKKLIWTRL